MIIKYFTNNTQADLKAQETYNTALTNVTANANSVK